MAENIKKIKGFVENASANRLDNVSVGKPKQV